MITTLIILLNKFEINNFKNWMIYNSIIVSKIDNFNKDYVYLDDIEENL